MAENGARQLTREDIAAMKAARTVVFWHHADDTFEAAALRDADDPIWGRIEHRRSIPLEASTVTDFDRPHTNNPGDHHEAAEVTHVYHDSPISTLIRLVHPGDGLRLRWFSGNDNASMRDADLHCDELRVEVYRAGRATRPNQALYHMLLSYRVCPDNSARMVKAV